MWSITWVIESCNTLEENRVTLWGITARQYNRVHRINTNHLDRLTKASLQWNIHFTNWTMREKLKQHRSLHIQTFHCKIFIQHILVSECTGAATPISSMQRQGSSTCEGKIKVWGLWKNLSKQTALTKLFKSQFD